MVEETTSMKPRRRQWQLNNHSQQATSPSRVFLIPWLLLVAWLLSSMPTTDAEVDSDDPQLFLYLKEDPESVKPIQEYKSTDPKTDVDNKRPAFIFDPQYEHHRIVEYYAHWCPHCQHFKPIYIKFARAMDELLTSIGTSSGTAPTVIEYHAISCVPNTKLCKNQNVKGYPHVKYYEAGSTEGKVIKHFELHPLTMLRLFGIPTTPGGGGGTQQLPHAAIADSGSLNNNYLKQPSNGQLSSGNPPYFMDRISQNELFHDAHLSFDFTMRTAIYATSESLEGDRKQTLKDFLVLLQRTLPPASNMQPVVDELLQRFDTEVIQGEEMLNSILDNHPIPPEQKDWSSACTQHGTGYTCGLWMLFHLITIGFVEWNSYVTIHEWSGINPIKAADTIRDFIFHYFLCEECRMHFVNEYDSCSYDRCNRLVDNHIKEGPLNTEPDFVNKQWIQFPLWLYETHNGVNKRLHNERLELRKKQQEGGNPADGVDYDSFLTDSDVMWPPKLTCPSCWLSPNDGRWDEENVYRYMRLTYWYG